MMKIASNTEGITPTAEFIENQYTGKFFQILPQTYMIKGAKSSRGFEQGYAISNSRKETILIDVVDAAMIEGVKQMVTEGNNFKAILITSELVLRDVYADLQTLSEDAGGAEIYLHKDITTEDGFKTKDLSNSDSLLRSFDLEIENVPAQKNGEVLVFYTRNDGMLFTGDSCMGSDYGSDEFTFTRGKLHNRTREFELEEFWRTLDKNFSYLLPRKGIPALEVDRSGRINILKTISRTTL